MEPTEVKVDKRTKEYKESVQTEVHSSGFDKDKEPYAKIENNPGFKRCMMCGAELPPNEDGSPKWRKFPEPCADCIWRNK